jgi:hypothetical protein
MSFLIELIDDPETVKTLEGIAKGLKLLMALLPKCEVRELDASLRKGEPKKHYIAIFIEKPQQEEKPTDATAEKTNEAV